MNFDRSEIQAMLIDSAERLLAEQAGVEYWREQRRSADGFDRQRWATFAQLGWIALLLPETAGGLGGSLEDVALLNIELGKTLATEPYVSSAVVAGHILAEARDEERAAPLLSAIAEGKLLVALAHDESEHDPLALNAPATHALRSDEGFILSGVKPMVLDAPSADRLIVTATMDNEEGTALFLVDPKWPGIDLAPYPLVDGTRAADIQFDRTAIPHDALLACGNRGATLLGEARDCASVALMAQAVGSMEACLVICGDYVKERKQFGQPIGSFQAIQHMLADMFVAANQARSILYYAIAASRDGAEAREAAVSAARIVVGEAGQLVSRNGIQLHGGYGITDEYPISHHYRRLMCIEKIGGDIGRHVRRLGDHVFAS